MKWEIQIPLGSTPYSRVQVNLETGSDEEIRAGLLFLQRVNNIHNGLETTEDKSLPSEIKSVLEEEHAQLKQEQAIHQDIINLLKDKDPELYSSIIKEVCKQN